MVLESVIQAIQKQVDEASPIVEKITYMKPIPVRPSYSSSSSHQYPEYGKTMVKIIEEEIK